MDMQAGSIFYAKKAFRQTSSTEWIPFLHIMTLLKNPIFLQNKYPKYLKNKKKNTNFAGYQRF